MKKLSEARKTWDASDINDVLNKVNELLTDAAYLVKQAGDNGVFKMNGSTMSDKIMTMIHDALLDLRQKREYAMKRWV